jgi:hypothetical protein
MRNEIQEPGRGILVSATRTSPTNLRALEPSAVDAALNDESTPVVAERGSRREFPARNADAPRMAIDDSHATSTTDGGLIRQLSRQLALMEAQQQQIRKLLEMTERRYAKTSEARIDR